MKLAIALLVCVICQFRASLCLVSCENDYRRPYPCSDSPDYYWRDYNGAIPKDAIVGGSDKDNVTYIGQVLHRESILPATIYPGQRAALSSAYGQAFLYEKSVKILCSQFADRFRWIATSTEAMHQLSDYFLVIGGAEVGHVLNIAKVDFERRVVIGKVFPAWASNKGLWIPKRNDREENLQSFEILGYERAIADGDKCN